MYRGYGRVVIAKNGNADYNNGLHSISGNGRSTDYAQFAAAGLIRLKKGDYVSVYVYSSSDSSWNVQSESAFSVNLLQGTSTMGLCGPFAEGCPTRMSRGYFLYDRHNLPSKSTDWNSRAQMEAAAAVGPNAI